MHLPGKFEVSSHFRLCQRKNKETKNHIHPLPYSAPSGPIYILLEPPLIKGKRKQKKKQEISFCSIEPYGKEARLMRAMTVIFVFLDAPVSQDSQGFRNLVIVEIAA